MNETFDLKAIRQKLEGQREALVKHIEDEAIKARQFEALSLVSC